MMLIFEWDKNKARTNLGKHKVSFEEAKTLFSDPLMVSYPDEHHSDIEERFVRVCHEITVSIGLTRGKMV
ncbi:MAG: BrnT family toxin [Caldilineales bacterium]|nr:BrnT family toxin [Caldilineales bacterium]